MSTTDRRTDNRTGARGVAIDVAANDLVHIGQDTLGHHHYLDCQHDRILVVDGRHEEYTAMGSVVVRRRLVVVSGGVEHVQTDGDVRNLERYVRFVAEAVADCDWATVAVTLLGAEDLLAGALQGGH